MLPTKAPLIIPVENQVRELDPKLLLACVAARRGFPSIIGSHRKIDFQIASFPRSLYLCKSFTAMNLKMFQIMHKLGHEIVSWDEEALVHLPANMYFSRRLSPLSLKYVSHLFAWGKDNAKMWCQYPEMPRDMPIHVTGNPRADLLRPEIHNFYRAEAEELRAAHGDFILVNTNFNHVNAFFPSQNLFIPQEQNGKKVKFGKAAKGMSREFAEALHDHKLALFDQFKKLIPALDKALPDFKIVVRPHPTENQDVYHKIAARCKRVEVCNDGNVVAWLMATKALIHNGCTTGVESYALGVPAISYRASVNEEIDQGFYGLPNQLSHQCFDFQELRETLGKILCGELGTADGDVRKALISDHVAAQEGPLACERMVDVLDRIAQRGSTASKAAPSDRLKGWSLANGRRLVKWLKSYIPGSHAPPAFHRHRYPGVSLTDLRERISRFEQILGGEGKLKTEQVSDQIFRISA